MPLPSPRMGISAVDAGNGSQALPSRCDSSHRSLCALQTMVPSHKSIGNSSLGTVVVRGQCQRPRLAGQVMNVGEVRTWKLERPATRFREMPRPGPNAWLVNGQPRVVSARKQICSTSTPKQLMLLGQVEEENTTRTMLPQFADRTAGTTWKARAQNLRYLVATELTPLARVPSLCWPNKLPRRPTDTRSAGEDGSVELLVWTTKRTKPRLAEVIAQVNQHTENHAAVAPSFYDLDNRDPACSRLLAIRFPGVRVTRNAPRGN